MADVRVRRLKIDSYGPLRDVDHDLDGGFNLFHGRNESGKTLLVEAVVKMMVDAGAEDFAGIGRVDGAPAGFIEVEAGDAVHQLPDADLEDVFHGDVHPRDVRNAFVVRDVDLRRPGRSADFGRGDYLRDVTDRVLGARTGEIERLQSRIADLGRLTSSYERLRDRQPEKLKSRVEEARELSKDLESYLESRREEGVLEDVRRTRRMEDERERVESEIQVLEKARRQAEVDDARELVDDLERVEDEIRRHREREGEVEELRGLKREIEGYRERRDDEDVDPEVMLNAVAALGLLFALSLLAAVLSSGAGVLLISGVVLAALLYAGQRYLDSRELVGEDERLVREVNYAGVDGSTLPDVYRAIEDQIQEYEEEGSRMQRERERVVGRLQEAFDAGHDDVDGRREEVERRAESVEEVDREYSEDELRSARERVDELDSEIDRTRERLSEHEDRLRELDRRLRDVAPEDYLDDVDEVCVDSAADLRGALDAVDRFLDEVTATRDAAQTAVDVLREIEQEEEEEIDQLFRGDGFVADVFERVTDGRYVDVGYDEGEGAVKVTRHDGRELSATELSQGTYDLLYLVVRLKLARELAGGEPGFLVLDAPFVHSDGERVRREVEVLSSLVDDGWQVVYLSFRDVVREAVEELGDGEVVELDELEL